MYRPRRAFAIFTMFFKVAPTEGKVHVSESLFDSFLVDDIALFSLKIVMSATVMVLLRPFSRLLVWGFRRIWNRCKPRK